MAGPVIATKLYLPKVRPGLVARPRLRTPTTATRRRSFALAALAGSSAASVCVPKPMVAAVAPRMAVR